eukprot:CAMPEP_0206600022 /NCGR_PEP_ID=MMETSP0325_2-20121206/45518_1 /ASSEMBLY_ACC=CAM_ASM_000347 /TAXON_ID=2866 /ORGANISM="Crypthecodinium cohnii, Strain Seligo" /LENGTH=109 /DNA_ID=CAMNT_0054111187 /DNA_START=150 /DNA_END=477 /DNA_ORIENTATION=-
MELEEEEEEADRRTFILTTVLRMTSAHMSKAPPSQQQKKEAAEWEETVPNYYWCRWQKLANAEDDEQTERIKVVQNTHASSLLRAKAGLPQGRVGQENQIKHDIIIKRR